MKNDLDLTAQIYRYRKISIFRAIFAIFLDFSQLFLLIVIYMWSPRWWAFPLVFVLIGAFQYNLLVILHDAQHGHLSNNRKTNDLIATWLLAAPFGVIFSKSRFIHMQHHQHLGIPENDPDFSLYCTKDPTPKDTIQKLILHFLRQIFWAKFIRMFLPNKQNKQQLQSNAESIKSLLNLEILAIFLSQFLIFSGFTITGHWHAYLYFWMLPLITVATFLNDARIFCEHSNPLDEKSKGKGLLISYLSNPLERFFFGPHHMNYHAEHHFFPFLPHYALPQVRPLLQARPEYQRQIQWRRSYWSHLKNYLKSTEELAIEYSSNKHSSEIIR